MNWQTEPDAGPVENDWEELDPMVWWTGRQWAVTGYGIERRDGKYTIDAASLGDTRTFRGRGAANWPLHMATKSKVVDQDDFMKAFLIALAIHQGRYPTLPEGWLEPTLEAIRQNERDADVVERLMQSPPSDADE